MTPYKRMPRRPFTDQIFNPYFKSSHYDQEHGQTERKIEGLFSKFLSSIKNIYSKNK